MPRRILTAMLLLIFLTFTVLSTSPEQTYSDTLAKVNVPETARVSFNIGDKIEEYSIYGQYSSITLSLNSQTISCVESDNVFYCTIPTSVLMQNAENAEELSGYLSGTFVTNMDTSFRYFSYLPSEISFDCIFVEGTLQEDETGKYYLFAFPTNSIYSIDIPTSEVTIELTETVQEEISFETSVSPKNIQIKSDIDDATYTYSYPLSSPIYLPYGKYSLSLDDETLSLCSQFGDEMYSYEFYVSVPETSVSAHYFRKICDCSANWNVIGENEKYPVGDIMVSIEDTFGNLYAEFELKEESEETLRIPYGTYNVEISGIDKELYDFVGVLEINGVTGETFQFVASGNLFELDLSVELSLIIHKTFGSVTVKSAFPELPETCKLGEIYVKHYLFNSNLEQIGESVAEKSGDTLCSKFVNLDSGVYYVEQVIALPDGFQLTETKFETAENIVKRAKLYAVTIGNQCEIAKEEVVIENTVYEEGISYYLPISLFLNAKEESEEEKQVSFKVVIYSENLPFSIIGYDGLNKTENEQIYTGEFTEDEYFSGYIIVNAPELQWLDSEKGIYLSMDFNGEYSECGDIYRIRLEKIGEKNVFKLEKQSGDSYSSASMVRCTVEKEEEETESEQIIVKTESDFHLEKVWRKITIAMTVAVIVLILILGFASCFGISNTNRRKTKHRRV